MLFYSLTDYLNDLSPLSGVKIIQIVKNETCIFVPRRYACYARLQ